MVKERTVLSHKLSYRGIDVNMAKNETIVKLLDPTTAKAIRCFFRHTRFYVRFIKDFSKIARL